MVYATAYYALVVRANIKAKSTILIHSATSCLGQACIHILQQHKSTILATVDTDQERFKLVNDLGIHVDNVFTTQSFVDEVSNVTKGKGMFILLPMFKTFQIL